MWFSIEVPFCGVFETTTKAMRFPLMLKGDTKTWPNEPLIELPLFPSSSAEFEQTVRTKNDGISMFSINPESFAPRGKNAFQPCHMVGKWLTMSHFNFYNSMFHLRFILWFSYTVPAVPVASSQWIPIFCNCIFVKRTTKERAAIPAAGRLLF